MGGLFGDDFGVGAHPVLQVDPLNPAGAGPGGLLGSRTQRFPAAEHEINPNTKVELGTLYRGVEGGTSKIDALRTFRGGDIGNGVYFTPSQELAASYGGGPRASVKAGTRTVHDYESQSLYPEDVAYIFGGAKHGEDFRLVAGNGIPLFQGPWSGAKVESALQAHPDIKAVIGGHGSIGQNQIALRDLSILNLKDK